MSLSLNDTFVSTKKDWIFFVVVIRQASFCLLVLKTFRLIAVLPLGNLQLKVAFFLSGLIDDGLQELIQRIVCLFCFTASVMLRINKICLF